MFKVLESHGVNVPLLNENTLAKVTGRYPIPRNAVSPDRSALNVAIKSAINNAQSEFLFDSSGRFDRRKLYFKTYFMAADGTIYPCLVDYWYYKDKNKVAVFLRNDAGTLPIVGEPLPFPWQPTHSVTLEGDETLKDARIMCGVNDDDSKLDGTLIDFFDVKCYEAGYSTRDKGTGEEVFFKDFEKVFQGKV